MGNPIFKGHNTRMRAPSMGVEVCSPPCRHACTPLRRFPCPLAASSLSGGSGVGRGSPRRSEGLNLFPSPPHGVEVGKLRRRGCCHHVRGKCPKNGDTSRVNIARDCIIGAEVPSMGLRSVPHRLQADRHACTPLRWFPCPLAASFLSGGAGVGRGSSRRSEGLNLSPSPTHGGEVGRIRRRGGVHKVVGTGGIYALSPSVLFWIGIYIPLLIRAV